MSQGSTYSGHEFESFANSPNYFNWIADVFRPHLSGDVTEIGAGAGTFSQRILPHANRLTLVEPSANLHPGLQAKFANQQKVTLLQSSIEEHLIEGDSQPQDAFVLVNVLEHIQDDDRAIMAMSDKLKVGGMLLVFVPALPFLFSKMDAGLGHYRRYKLSDLQKQVEVANLTVIDIRYFDILGILPWWLINTLGKQTRFNPQMVGLYDKVGVPITRFMEGLVIPPIGKNIILIARKDNK
ncbi:MAG: methyltransferase [Magnetococcales bacterium]|nr:methyltransferase [Magnetococcales bacterium]